MELLNIIISFPTVVFTVLTGVSLLYWGMVILGALDAEALDLGGFDGATEGAVEGATEGAVEGAVEGATEGAVEGAVEGATEGAVEGATEGAVEGAAHGAGDGVEASPGGLAGFLTALRLRHAPFTVVFSLISILSWLLCIVGMGLVAPALPEAVPVWLFGTLLLVVALCISVPLTSVISRPLGQFFIVHEAPRRRTLVGKICTVTTGKVTPDFGQAEYDDGGAGMIIQVRCDVDDVIRRGSRALIVSYDSEREAYVVEPYDELLSKG